MNDTDLITRNLQAIVQTEDGRCRFINAILAAGLNGSIRLAALKVIPYEAYLKTDHWRATATAAKERVGNLCQLCNQGERLNAHHRTYARRGEERPEDLTVLCHDCHAKFHGKLASAVARDKPISDEPPATPDPETIAFDSMTEAEQLICFQQMLERKREQQKALMTSVRSGT